MKESLPSCGRHYTLTGLTGERLDREAGSAWRVRFGALALQPLVTVRRQPPDETTAPTLSSGYAGKPGAERPHAALKGVSPHGMSGVDLSAGTIMSAMKGLGETQKVLDWKYGSAEDKATLAGVNMLGWTGAMKNQHNVNLSKALWSKELTARFEDLGEQDYGYYERERNENEIVLAKSLVGGGLEGAAKLATAMSHEEDHWLGNRIEALAHKQGITTYGQISAMFNLEPDSEFSNAMIEAYLSPESSKENEGARDYWKVMKNGDLYDDGLDDQISFEDGRETIKTGKGKQGTLEQCLGMEANTGYSLLMQGAGYRAEDYIGNGKWSVSGKTISALAIKDLIESGKVTNADYIANSSALYNLSQVQNLMKSSTVVGKQASDITDSITEYATKGEQWLAQNLGIIINYYDKKQLSKHDFSGIAITTYADTEQHNYPDPVSVYENGHPGIDVAGVAGSPFTYPKDLLLVGTRDDRQLLYQISGTQDYFFINHVDATDVQALENLLSVSTTGKIPYKAGSTLFLYPALTDKNSTGPHIHAELYRKRMNGSYWFADPLTGKMLPAYQFGFSNDLIEYRKWLPKLPEYLTTW